MSRTIKLVLEYDGTEYSGFQRQKNGLSIQGALEESLQTICDEKITIIGAGRTDAGVHALGQVCHFKTSSKLAVGNFIKALNTELPHDIVIHDLKDMSADFHARHRATARTYAYFILNRPTPSAILERFLKWIPHELDVKAMNEACKYLIGEKDFSSFSKTGSSRKNPITNVSEACCFRGTGKLKVPFSHLEKEVITFHFKAKSFLYSMVRIMVGTLLEIGKGKKNPKDIERILHGGHRHLIGPTFSPKGLFLMKVDYPNE